MADVMPPMTMYVVRCCKSRAIVLLDPVPPQSCQRRIGSTIRRERSAVKNEALYINFGGMFVARMHE